MNYIALLNSKRVTGLSKFDGMHFVPQWPTGVAIDFVRKVVCNGLVVLP